MLILPHSTALDLEGHAYTTYAITILCIIIFYFQFNNEQLVQNSIENYCNAVHIKPLNDDSINLMRTDIGSCKYFLSVFHTKVEFLIPERLRSITGSEFYKYNAQMDEVISLMQDHYEAFRKTAPESLNAQLMYYPHFPNPIKMVTSSIAHGDIFHITGNLIFFLAFAPALELLIGSVFKYLGIMLIISFTTSLSYSLVTLLSSSDGLPGLGLSGVVMGMIGLSAYLMPKAKIRVFIWWFTFARNIYISAWILAIWYIGWDAWDLLTSSNHGGVNLIAHVSGGITGYLIGFFWLKETYDDTRDELADEIEYQRSQRADRHSSYNLSFSGNRQYINNKQQERQFKKDHDQYMGKLYQCVSVHNDSEAIVLILDDYDFQRVYVENYEELFQRIMEWGNSRTALCVGRICISLLLEKKSYKRASIIFTQCHNISPDFLLADPAEVLLLAWGMVELQQYNTACDLIHNAEQHYGKYIDVARCQLLEIDLLLQQLNKPEEAHKIMNMLLINPANPYKTETLDLARRLQNCS